MEYELDILKPIDANHNYEIYITYFTLSDVVLNDIKVSTYAFAEGEGYEELGSIKALSANTYDKLKLTIVNSDILKDYI